MRIVADENIPFVVEAFSTFGSVTTVSGRKLCRDDVIDADILLVRSVTKVNRSLLEGTKVTFVATATIGTDHIDQTWLRENEISFAHAPGSNANSVAEYVLTALTVLKQRLQFNPAEITVGIVGVGNIGSKIFKLVTTLGMRPLLCDPPLKRATGDSCYRPLEEIMEESDIITFHVPLIKSGEDQTYHLVNATFLSKLKKGVSLINTSRGKVFDELALLAYRQHIGGLVLDVWENEPSINGELLQKTTIATPHIAGYSYDGKLRGTEAIYRAACTLFNKTPEWSSLEVLNNLTTAVSTKLPGFNVVDNTIVQAYPIEEDDKHLRAILSIDPKEQPRYFDELRKKYYKRLEFSHYDVMGEMYDDETRGYLRQLGFKA